MKRTTIFLTEELHEQLRRDAFRAKVSMAEIIRLKTAVADALEEAAGGCRGSDLESRRYLPRSDSFPDPDFNAVANLRRAATENKNLRVTTDYVLDEAITRLFSTTPFAQASKYVEGIFQASRSGGLDIEHITPSASQPHGGCA